MVANDFTAFTQGFVGIIDIVKGLKSAYDANKIMDVRTEMLEKLLSLQSGALALQQEHSTTINENQKLQAELTNFVKWDETAAQYQLVNVDMGTFVYAIKKSQESQQPPHWLCTNCFNQRQKSILQPDFTLSGKYRCPRCALELFVRGKPQYAM